MSHFQCLSLLLSSSSDPVRDALLRKSDLWFSWLLASTAVVAVGVILEFPEGWNALTNWRRRRRGIPEVDHGASWAIPASFLGIALVIAGVVGEGIFEGLLTNADTAVRRHDVNAVAGINLEAKQADERAAKADLKRIELENRIVDIFGSRELTTAQSVRVARRLGGLRGVKVDVYVFALGNPYNPTKSKDDANIGISVVRTLRAAGIDAEGWLLGSCQGGGGGANVVVSVNGTSDDYRTIAMRLIKAFEPEIGTYPEIQENLSPAGWCREASDLDPARPNKRKHDAIISIIIGSKSTPLLTREMLESAGEQKGP